MILWIIELLVNLWWATMKSTRLFVHTLFYYPDVLQQKSFPSRADPSNGNGVVGGSYVKPWLREHVQVPILILQPVFPTLSLGHTSRGGMHTAPIITSVIFVSMWRWIVSWNFETRAMRLPWSLKTCTNSDLPYHCTRLTIKTLWQFIT